VDADVVDRLCRLLRSDPVPEVRREAARALGVAGSEVVEALVEALDDANDGVRRAAALALGRVRDPRATDALVRALETRHELWQEASAALATSGDERLLERLTPLLDAQSTAVRRGAIRAVAAVSRRENEDAGETSEPLFVYTDEDGHRHPLF
jgi:HEAT repeat protein